MASTLDRFGTVSQDGYGDNREFNINLQNLSALWLSLVSQLSTN